MSWEAVARKDFHDAVRSRWLWALSVLSIVMFAGAAVARLYVGGGPGGQQAQGVLQGFLFFLKQGTGVVIPLMAIVVSYASVTREWESGTLKLLLALPHSRDDVIVGKVLGRSAVVALPILVGFVVALIALVPAASGANFVDYFFFALLTALLGVVFVGISVGISALAQSNRQAIVGSVVLFGTFLFLWNTLVQGITRALTSVFSLSQTSQFQVKLALKLLNPIQTYKSLVNSLFMSDLEARVRMFSMLFGLIPNQKALKALGPELAVVFSDPFAVLYLLVWLVVPVAVGVVWFRERDL